VPELKIRVVNVVDLMKLQPPSEHPHGLSDRDFDGLFTTSKPVIFAFHGYPWLIHGRLPATNHANLHVRGYKERAPRRRPSTWRPSTSWTVSAWHATSSTGCRTWSAAAYEKQALRDALFANKQYIADHGEDMPATRNWRWKR